ncbi:MAG: NAD(P)/FAD-dependent oxidoreductase [Chthoniobacteraceae bacterium]
MSAPHSPPIDDVLILGAGAAGLMCAITAGQRGRSVRLLERAERPGKKILISGGGRCNFTNLYAGPDNYISSEPAFCRSALARYQPRDFIDLVERHGIPYHEKKLGQLFCDGSSREIVALLTAECAAAKVRIETNADAGEISRDADGLFSVRVGGGEFRARALVVATGGLTWPKLGGSDIAYRVARQFGLRIIPPRPGLVPLTFAGARPFRAALLFTHRGLSGPAVLQVSSYLPGENGAIDADVTFDLLPDAPDDESWLTARHGHGDPTPLPKVLAERLPARVAEAFCRSLDPPRPLRQYSVKALAALDRTLRQWTLRPSATEGYAKAEVTLGGIDTRDLHSRTMETRAVPGLYFIGEAVDVTGQLGGFNFQWAWASGHAAGEAA